jgi:hypothetical protein
MTCLTMYLLGYIMFLFLWLYDMLVTPDNIPSLLMISFIICLIIPLLVPLSPERPRTASTVSAAWMLDRYAPEIPDEKVVGNIGQWVNRLNYQGFPAAPCEECDVALRHPKVSISIRYDVLKTMATRGCPYCTIIQKAFDLVSYGERFSNETDIVKTDRNGLYHISYLCRNPWGVTEKHMEIFRNPGKLQELLNLYWLGLAVAPMLHLNTGSLSNKSQVAKSLSTDGRQLA